MGRSNLVSVRLVCGRVHHADLLFDLRASLFPEPEEGSSLLTHLTYSKGPTFYSAALCTFFSEKCHRFSDFLFRADFLLGLIIKMVAQEKSYISARNFGWLFIGADFFTLVLQGNSIDR